MYADDHCSKPVASGGAEVLSMADRSTCPQRVRVYARAEEYKGAVYRLSEGMCAFVSAQPPAWPKVTYNVYGPELAPERFVATPLLER
jgi:hypothetical protein